MNSRTKLKLQILITRLQMVLVRLTPLNDSPANAETAREIAEFQTEAEELKQALEHDETILELR